MKKPSPKLISFRAHYLVHGNATQAACEAGYKFPNKVAERLVKKPFVKKALEAGQRRAEKNLQITKDRILSGLVRIAECDLRKAYNEDGSLKSPQEMPEDVALALSSMEVDELFDGVGKDRMQVGLTKKIRFWDKVRAYELLGKHLKLFTEKIEHSGTLGELLDSSWDEKKCG